MGDHLLVVVLLDIVKYTSNEEHPFLKVHMFIAFGGSCIAGFIVLVLMHLYLIPTPMFMYWVMFIENKQIFRTKNKQTKSFRWIQV